MLPHMISQVISPLTLCVVERSFVQGTMSLVLNVSLTQSKDVGRYFRNFSTVVLNENGTFGDLVTHVRNVYNVNRVTFKFNNKDIPLTGVRVKDAADKLGLRNGSTVYGYIA